MSYGMKDLTEGLGYNSVIEPVLRVHKAWGSVLRARTHRSEMRDGITKESTSLLILARIEQKTSDIIVLG